MFTRIVKMEFEQQEIPGFLASFELVKEDIRNFPGCEFLELYRDKENPTVFFTYSKWKEEKDLEHYRSSPLFKQVWSQTKARFRNKARAWSVDTIYKLD